MRPGVSKASWGVGWFIRLVLLTLALSCNYTHSPHHHHPQAPWRRRIQNLRARAALTELKLHGPFTLSAVAAMVPVERGCRALVSATLKMKEERKARVHDGMKNTFHICRVRSGTVILVLERWTLLLQYLFSRSFEKKFCAGRRRYQASIHASYFVLLFSRSLSCFILWNF